MSNRKNINIHISAVVSEKAIIGENVSIGPYCIVGDNVSLGDNIILKSHVVIDGITEIGSNTEIFPFASIGLAPQDLKYNGEESKLIIGKNNKIREYVTLQPGTAGGGMITKIGDNCLFMASSHVAHDCKLGNNVIMANNATLGGHVEIGDFAVIGGLAAIHQFVRIGAYAMIGGMSGIERDVIPYGLALGERASLAGLNFVGMKRQGLASESMHAIRNAYKMLFNVRNNEDNFEERLKKISAEYHENINVMEIVKFLDMDSSRAICQPKNGNNEESSI
jgi:UDP-N-acetylglucosamine acyltransferase